MVCLEQGVLGKERKSKMVRKNLGKWFIVFGTILNLLSLTFSLVTEDLIIPIILGTLGAVLIIIGTFLMILVLFRM